MLVSSESIKMGLPDGKLLVIRLVNVDGIKLGLGVGTKLISLHESYFGSYYGNIKGLLI